MTRSEGWIALDLETTGLSATQDRIVEVGLSGKNDDGSPRQWLVNPTIPIPIDATRVHGITDAMVRDKPIFADLAPELLLILAQSEFIVAFNADFDMAILNAELRRMDIQPIPASRFRCSSRIARQVIGGADSAKRKKITLSLDGACHAFKISTDHRIKHRADIDAELAAEVYRKAIERLPDRRGMRAEPPLPPTFQVAQPRPFGNGDVHRDWISASLANPIWRSMSSANSPVQPV